MVVYKGINYPSLNEIVSIKDGIATLRNVRQDMFFTVSEIDLPAVLMHTWHIKDGYFEAKCSAVSRRKNGMIPLHHFILGFPEEGYVVDHINRNTSDNTRKNLRFVTYRGNNINTSRVDKSVSRFLGVSKTREGFCAGFYLDRRYYLCRSKDEIICALYYDKYVLLNFPGEATNFSLGNYSEEDLKRFGISSVEDILNFKFNFRKLKSRFYGVHFNVGNKTFRGSVQRNFGSKKHTKVFISMSERISVIKRELFLDEHIEWVTIKTKRNDLLSLFIPQPGQKFIIPKYIDENGNIKECEV